MSPRNPIVPFWKRGAGAARRAAGTIIQDYQVLITGLVAIATAGIAYLTAIHNTEVELQASQAKELAAQRAEIDTLALELDARALRLRRLTDFEETVFAPVVMPDEPPPFLIRRRTFDEIRSQLQQSYEFTAGAWATLRTNSSDLRSVLVGGLSEFESALAMSHNALARAQEASEGQPYLNLQEEFVGYFRWRLRLIACAGWNTHLAYLERTGNSDAFRASAHYPQEGDDPSLQIIVDSGQPIDCDTAGRTDDEMASFVR